MVNSFCHQIDDWMLLKITEKIIKRNVFEQKKKITGLSAHHALEPIAPFRTSIARSIYSRTSRSDH